MALIEVKREVKRPAEVRVYGFGFGKQPELLNGETLTGTPTVVGDPAGLVIGVPAIGGSRVNVQISGGSDGTEYHLAATCNTSGGKTLVVCGRLAVEMC